MTAALTAAPGPSDPTKIVFFGLGAVGSNLLICLAELAERDAIRRDLVAWDIDLFQSVRDASEV